MDRAVSRGYSLIELMIGMALITIALLAMIGVFFSGLRLMTQGEALTQATESGRALLETVKVYGYDTIPATSATFDGRNNDPPLANFPPTPYPRGANDYPMRVRVEMVRAGLKNVWVEVFYDPRKPPAVVETFFVQPPVTP